MTSFSDKDMGVDDLPIILNFIGHKRSGKDSAVDFIASEYHIAKLAYSDPLEQLVKVISGHDECFAAEYKDVPVSPEHFLFPMSPRQIAIRLARDLDKWTIPDKFFSLMMERRLRAWLSDEDAPWVACITGARRRQEIETLNQFVSDGSVRIFHIRVDRPGTNSIDDIGDDYYDLINNQIDLLNHHDLERYKTECLCLARSILPDSDRLDFIPPYSL